MSVRRKYSEPYLPQAVIIFDEYLLVFFLFLFFQVSVEEEAVSTTTEAVSGAIAIEEKEAEEVTEEVKEAEEVTEEETETKEILRTENFVKATEA